jgi:hypothetical protein
MTLRTLCLIVAALWCLPAKSQTDSIKEKRKIGFYSHVGATYGNFSELNSTLSPIGYPELRNFYGGPTYGITLSNKPNNSYSFIAVSILSSNPASPFVVGTQKYSRLRSWEIQVGRVFDLVKSPKWLVYPFFGEGIGYGEFTLYDNISQQSFVASASNLSVPNRKTWTSFYLQFNAGAGIERRLRIGAHDFYLGASGGYRLSFSRFTEDHPLSSTAPIQLSGFEWNIKLRFELWRLPNLKRN